MLWLYVLQARESKPRLLQGDGFRASAQHASVGSRVAERTGGCSNRAHPNARNCSVSSCTSGNS